MNRMKKLIKTLLLCCTIISGSIAQNIDSKKSLVNFEVDNMKFNTVEGTFSGMEGTVKLDPKTPSNSSFNVCIDASTVNTDNSTRDDHLKTEDFFNTKKYPSICFKSTQVTYSSGTYHVKGKLTMHGTTKEVKIPLKFKNNTFTGRFKANRLDYGVGKETSEFMVENEIEIEITCTID